MNLFSNAGMMVQLPSDSQLMSVYLEDDYSAEGIFEFRNRLAVITSCTTDENALVQLRQMFNDRLYINVFGDSPGMMSISGMFVGGTCDPDEYYVGTSGFELISSYYRQHRASRKMLALSVAIGGFMTPMLYEAFLLKCQTGLVDPQLQIGQFSWTLAYPMDLPEYERVSADFSQIGDFPNPPGYSPGDTAPPDDGDYLA